MPGLSLPDFVIIGGVKCATSWLHAQLQTHPQLFLPDPEVHYFSQAYDRGLAYYSSFFERAGAADLVGEKSADYLAHPETAARMAADLPNASLVVQLRNPVDRCYSDYKMLYRRGTVSAQIDDYLGRGADPRSRFLNDGLFSRHLARWLDHFPANQIKVVLFEDVMSSPRQTLASVCAHIGAPPHFAREIGAKAVKDSTARLLPLRVRTTLAPLKATVKPLRGQPLFEKVRGLLAREVEYPPLSADTRARLVEFYARDIERLEVMLGRSLDDWVLRKEAAA